MDANTTIVAYVWYDGTIECPRCAGVRGTEALGRGLAEILRPERLATFLPGGLACDRCKAWLVAPDVERLEREALEEKQIDWALWDGALADAIAKVDAADNQRLAVFGPYVARLEWGAA